jgi:translation initiation factor 2B subunit (eIF-2B alpha/beta/delta family)
MKLNILRALEKLSGDTVSPSTVLLERAVDCVVKWIPELPDKKQRKEFIIALHNTQPSMAVIRNLAYLLLINMDKTEKQLKELAAAYLRKICSENDKIADLAYPLLALWNSIALYSYSATVYYVFEKYYKKLKNITLYCSDCRPNREGLLLAKALARLGYTVQVHTDIGLLSHSNEWDALITGADYVCSRGVGNKVGTHVLAQFCAMNKKSCYVLAGSSKFVSHPLVSVPITSKTKGLTMIEEDYFDLTPLKYITYLIMEKRLYTSKDLKAYFKSGSFSF